jgi:uncharacterized protein (DUF1800 family)
MTTDLLLETYRRAQREANALPEPDAKREAQQAARRMQGRWVSDLTHAVLADWVNRGWQGHTVTQAFWLNHFNVHAGRDTVGAALPSFWQDVVLAADRRFAEVLLSALTHPAMLVYLDNTQNRRNQLNENLARELLELHTLGAQGGYAQADVQEVARVLTGLGLSRPPGSPEQRWPFALTPQVVQRGQMLFDPARHDFGPKRVLGRTLDSGGWADVQALCELLAAHPATARHISRQWLRCLTGAEPEAAVWQDASAQWPVSQANPSNPGHMGAWTAAVQARLVQQPYAPGQPLKTPWQWLVEVAHAVAAGRPVQDAERLARWCQQLGQRLFFRSTPDGYSWLGADWANPGQLTLRWQVARALVSEQARVFGAGLSVQDVLQTPLLRQMQEHVSPQTAMVLEAAASPAERLVLLLLAPETMTHRQTGAAST